MSRRITNVNSEIFIGKGAGDAILESIHNARRSVRIMSPYLSAKLVDVLLELYHSGIHIELITSDDIEDHKYTADKNSYKIIRQHKHIDQQLKSRKEVLTWLGLGLMILMGLLLLIKLPRLLSYSVNAADIIQSIVLGSLVLIGHFLWKRGKEMIDYFFTYSSLFPIKIFHSYFSRKSVDKSRAFTLHSKLYIIDDRIAYLGSVNFTTSGSYFNHETRIKVTDPYAVEELMEEFDGLLQDRHYNERSVTEWGRELYEGELQNNTTARWS